MNDNPNSPEYKNGNKNQENNDYGQQPPQQNEDYFQDDNNESQDYEQYAPAVAAPPAQKIVYLIVFGGVMLLLLFTFFGGEEREDEIVKTKKRISTRDADLPPLPTAPPSLPKPPPLPKPPTITQSTRDTNVKRRTRENSQARIQSNMVIVSGGRETQDRTVVLEENFGRSEIYAGANDENDNTGWTPDFYDQDKVPSAMATRIPGIHRVLAQGKMIDAVLETPINTDLPGPCRAIVSRNIYSESGTNVLITKGSRLFGVYNSFVNRGQKRVAIVWTRVLRPDGVSVSLRSPGADALGRVGVNGFVDNKYQELFGNAFLLSAINLGTGILGDAVVEDSETTQSSTGDGRTVTTGTAGAKGLDKALNNFDAIAQGLIAEFLSLSPTITINQGAEIRVVVNRDLVFPVEMANGIQFVH